MHLSGKDYVPTLSLRPGEMNALEYLPDAAKERMTPVILLAPWVNSKTLNQAVERIQRAFPGRKFILDIDRNYTIPFDSMLNAAKEEWNKLSEADGDCADWYEFCANFQGIVPCLRLRSNSDINLQLEDIRKTGIEFSVRLTPDIYVDTVRMQGLFDSLKDIETPYSIIIDGEWTNNALSLFEQHEMIIKNYLNNLGSHVHIVSSCTSMIKDFQSIDGLKDISFSNRDLTQQLGQITNRQIIYGDWGSTRPRELKSMRRTPIPRIDYPTSHNSWLISRPTDRLYQHAAQDIIQNKDWDLGMIDLWGVNLIKATAEGKKGIDNPRTNTAARINIHLYRQSMLGNSQNNFDEDALWID